MVIPGGDLVPPIPREVLASFGLPEHPTIVGLFEGYGGLTLGVQHVTGGRLVAYSEIEPSSIKLLQAHFPDVPNLGDVSTIDWGEFLALPMVQGALLPAVRQVDIMLGGFPCQDVSVAGLGAGLHPGTRSGLWFEFARAIAETRPKLVVIENVAGLRSTKAGASAEEADNDEHEEIDPNEDVYGPDGSGPLRDLEPGEDDLGDPARGGRPVLRALGAVLGDLAALGYDAEWHSVRASNVGAPHRRERVFVIAWPRDPAANA
jgi:DNA (cytosine-5)-methyltransferase 1